MAASSISIYQATLAGRREVYEAYLAAGKGTPFIYPWDTFPALYLFLGIVLRPYVPSSFRRPFGLVVFILVVVHSAYVCVNRRTLGFASGYGLGLTSTWGIIMTGVLLLAHEPEKDFARLEIREGAAATTYTQTPEGVVYSVDKKEALSRVNRQQNKGDFTQTFVPEQSKQNKRLRRYYLIWQPFPKDIWHCTEWTLDLMSSFRGPNWNFRIPTLHKIQVMQPPRGYQLTRAIETSMLANEIQNPSDPSSESFIRKTITDTATLYIAVDLVKSVIVTDPYFLGLRPLTSVSPWPLLQGLPFLTKVVRLGIALCSVVICLSFVFSLGPLGFYTILSRIFPQAVLLKVTKAPFYDPRMYAPQFKSLSTNVAAAGLAGFWGQSWHQMFRFGISEPSKPIVAYLNLKPKSQATRMLLLLTAFFLTGSIHAVASYTTFSIIKSKPFNPWLFFMLQGAGIILQTALKDFLIKRMGILAPDGLKRASNVAFVVLWLWFTGPLLSDDFARAGVWLFEPVPISIFRGLTGNGWWCWGGTWAGLWRGNSVFSSGIAAY